MEPKSAAQETNQDMEEGNKIQLAMGLNQVIREDANVTASEDVKAIQEAMELSLNLGREDELKQQQEDEQLAMALATSQKKAEEDAREKADLSVALASPEEEVLENTLGEEELALALAITQREVEDALGEEEFMRFVIERSLSEK